MTTNRKRAVNFSQTENRLLVDLVLEKKHIIENKQSDAVMWSNKKEAWHEIAMKFNAACGQRNRTAEGTRSYIFLKTFCIINSFAALRIKYKTIKKDLRKKKASIKREMYITGGGRVSCGGEMLDYEERLLPVIITSVEGLPSVGDCDNQAPVVSAYIPYVDH